MIPVAMDECRRRIGGSVEYASDMYDAVLEADALLLLTEWKQFPVTELGRNQENNADATDYRRSQHL